MVTLGVAKNEMCPVEKSLPGVMIGETEILIYIYLNKELKKELKKNGKNNCSRQ